MGGVLSAQFLISKTQEVGKNIDKLLAKQLKSLRKLSKSDKLPVKQNFVFTCQLFLRNLPSATSYKCCCYSRFGKTFVIGVFPISLIQLNIGIQMCSQLNDMRLRQ